MNPGLLLKSWREIRLPTVLFGFGLALAEVLLAFILPPLEKDFSSIIAQLGFFETLFKALMGTELGQGVGPVALQTIAWVDPVVLALIWAHAIVVCTRVPAGEIDRGTADVLFGLPVSRWNVYVCDSAVCIVSGAIVITLAWLGHVLGSKLAPTSFHLGEGRLFIVLLNLFCLGAAVGGAAYLASALSERRGRAIAAVFAIVLASFLLNFIAQFWQPADRISFLGMLNYYRPVRILQDGTWPVRNILVLLAVGSVLWTAGGVVMARRDIATT